MFAALSRPVVARSCVRAPGYAAARYASRGPSSSTSSSSKNSQKPAQTPAPEEVAAEVEPQGVPKPLPSLDVLATTEPTPGPDGERGRTGARSADDDTLTSAEHKRRNLTHVMFGLMFAGFAANIVHMGREWEEEELAEKKVKSVEELPNTRWGRTSERVSALFDYFNKPSWPELLPPPLPAPHQKPYTLLISIDDLLVTSTWDRQHGWRTAKRPGVDYFLAYLSQFYEVVIFTTQNHYTALPVLENLDRYNFYINYKLFREATRSINGKIVKDLSYLNRDLSKVISLDTSADHTSTHPENAIILPKWKGDPRDHGLIAMIPFLESIAIYKPKDIRPILEAYKGKDIPTQYAKNEAEAKRRHIEEWTKKKGKTGGGLSLTGFMGGTSGSKSPIPPTYLEAKRAEAQMQYKQELQFIQEHREELEKLRKQDEEAAMGQAPGNLWEALSQMQGGPEGAAGEKQAVAQAPSAQTPGAAPATPAGKA